MAQETPPVGPHDEWLTEELARLRDAGQGGFPLIPLIARLREHTGMGLKEAKDVVEDYGRRNKLRPTPACAGNQTVWWVWTAAILVLLLLSILGGSIAPHLTRRHQWFFVHAMTALSWGLVVLSLVFSGVAVYQVLRKGRKPPN